MPERQRTGICNRSALAAAAAAVVLLIESNDRIRVGCAPFRGELHAPFVVIVIQTDIRTRA